MDFLTILQNYGPGTASLFLILTLVLYLVKNLIPSIYRDFSNRKAQQETHSRQVEEQELNASRQDEIAVWSQQSQLVTQVIAQNKYLIDYITERIDGELAKLSATISQELADIEGRWLAATREITNTAKQVEIMRMELVRLVDNYKSIEERIISVAAYGIKDD